MNATLKYASNATLFEKLLLRVHRRWGFEPRWIPTGCGVMRSMVAAGKGQLPPLVMMHGLATSGVQMARLSRRLQPHVQRLEVLDLLGHGFSEQPSSGLDPRSLTESTLEALDALPGPFALLGNSMGGLAALRYALARPHRVSHLILCSPGGAPVDEHELARVKANFEVRSYGEALQFLDRLFGKPHPLRHALALGVQYRLRQPHLAKLLNAISLDDLLSEDEVSDLKIPTLLVWGDQDEILPPRSLEFFRSSLPTLCSVLELKGVGHSAHLEQPARLAEATLALLAT